jgi:environmental stress-induced protein Ves
MQGVSMAGLAPASVRAVAIDSAGARSARRPACGWRAKLLGWHRTMALQFAACIARAGPATVVAGGTDLPRDTMATQRVLSPAEYRRMPWKNGGGRTTEIAAYPAGAGFDAFVWRVSIADVHQSGPFSAFTGVDRTLVLLEGKGMRLAGEGSPLDVHTAFEPVAFAGDEIVQCTLVAGPVRDFNLMVRRGAARGDIVVLRAGEDTLPPATFHVCYAAQGASECLVAGHPPIPLQQDHALLHHADAGGKAPALHVYPLAAGAIALVAVIDLA